VQLSDPPQYLGMIELTAPEICLPEPRQKEASPAQVSAYFGGNRPQSLVGQGHRKQALAEGAARDGTAS